MKDSFDELAALYRADEPPSAPLVSAVRRGRLKLVAGLVVGLAVCVFGVTFGLGILLAERDGPSALFAAIQIGVPFVIVGRWLVSSRQSWRAAGGTTVDFLRLDVERLRHQQRMLRFGVWIMPVFVPAMLAWQVWHGVAHADVYRAHPMSAVIGFGGTWVILGTVVVFGVWREGRKARQQLAQAEATLAAVSET